MKFLVITKGNKHLVPPEALLARTDALTAWVTRYTEMGKIDAAWSFAGVAGGGAIFNVDSLEELDAIMVEFPFGPFSEVDIRPLVDLNESNERLKQAFTAMVQAMQA